MATHKLYNLQFVNERWDYIFEQAANSIDVIEFEAWLQVPFEWPAYVNKMNLFNGMNFELALPVNIDFDEKKGSSFDFFDLSVYSFIRVKKSIDTTTESAKDVLIEYFNALWIEVQSLYDNLSFKDLTTLLPIGLSKSDTKMIEYGQIIDKLLDLDHNYTDVEYNFALELEAGIKLNVKYVAEISAEINGKFKAFLIIPIRENGVTNLFRKTIKHEDLVGWVNNSVGLSVEDALTALAILEPIDDKLESFTNSLANNAGFFENEIKKQINILLND